MAGIADTSEMDNAIYPEGHTPKWWRQHPEAWAEALRNSPPKHPPRGANTSTPMANHVLRGLAGSSLIIGGLGVISKELFWPGVVIVYFGCFVLYLETILEPWMLRRALGLQCAFIAGSLGITMWFTLAVVLRSGPMTIESDALRNTNHADGDVVEGIRWDRHFTELQIAVSNASDSDYHDLDIAIQPDTWAFAAAIKNKPSQCELLPIEYANQLRVAIAKSTGAIKGRIVKLGGDFDLNDSAGNAYVTIGRDRGYRLRCTAFPRRSTVLIIFATVAPNPDVLSKTPVPAVKQPGGLGVGLSEWSGAKSEFDLLGDRPNPRFVALNGTYYVGLRRFSLSRTVDVQDGD
jgi:hypothetical protein